MIMALLKRSLRLSGHRTSVALETEFWTALDEIARLRGLSMPRLLALIEEARVREAPDANLASAARVYALKHSPPRLTK
jgi:predicted DNA-binding ribbon-helix-helix protein